MFTLRIEKFIEAIASRLGAIENALREYNRSANANQIRQDSHWSGIGRKIAEMRPDDEYKRSANTYKHKSYRQQVVLNILTACLAIFTLGAFVAAGIYAFIAKGQLEQMIDSGKQNSKQLCLFQNQLVLLQSQTMDERKLANATFDQAMIALQEQGPHLAMGLIGPIVGTDDPQHIYVRIDARNNGRTAVVRAKGAWKVMFVPRYSDPPFTYPKNSASTFAFSLLEAGVSLNDGIAPPKKISLPVWELDGTKVTSNGAYARRFADRDSDLVFYGKVDFKDVFGVSHWETFCIVQGYFDGVVMTGREHPKCADYNRQDMVNFSPPSKNQEATNIPLPKMKDCEALFK